MQSNTEGKGTLVLQTVVAMVLSFVVYMVGATLAAMFVYFTQSLFTVIRPGIIEFFAVVVGSVVGMGAAKAACDAVLRAYSHRSVFVMFAILTAVAIFIEIFYVPMQLNQINSAAQIITAVITAYVCFWQNEKNLF